MSACRYRMHAPGDTCDCKARLAAVSTHTRTSTGGYGPDFCEECSRAISEWVPWPCTDAAPATPDPTPGEEELSEAIRAGLRKCRVEDAPVPLIRDHDLHHVTHMVKAEVEPLLAALHAEHKAEVEVLTEALEFKRLWPEKWEAWRNEHAAEKDAPECERCEGTGDRYGRPGNCTPNTAETTCPDCWGTGYVIPPVEDAP